MGRYPYRAPMRLCLKSAKCCYRRCQPGPHFCSVPASSCAADGMGVAKDGAILAQAVSANGRSVPPRLAGALRSGTPPACTAEQICAIAVTTCKKWSEGERRIGHWSKREAIGA
jgi:hypothetical protein